MYYQGISQHIINFFSTETAVCGIVSDLLEYINESKGTISILLN